MDKRNRELNAKYNIDFLGKYTVESDNGYLKTDNPREAMYYANKLPNTTIVCSKDADREFIKVDGKYKIKPL